MESFATISIKLLFSWRKSFDQSMIIFIHPNLPSYPENFSEINNILLP